MTEEEKQELEVWKPQRPFEGSDLLPELKPVGELTQLPPGGIIGRENIEPEDMIIPALQLLQGQSEAITDGVDGAKPGKFYLSTTGQVMDAPLRILLIHHGRSRALFPKPDDPRSRDLRKCLSPDAYTGRIYGVCEDCQYQKWTGKDKEIKPICSESHNFTVWTDAGPAILRFANSSFKAAKEFLTAWEMQPQKNLWSHPVLVFVKKRSKALPGGKDSTYFTMEMRWDRKEDIPFAYQGSAVELHKKLAAAHETGHIKVVDEDAGFQE